MSVRTCLYFIVVCTLLEGAVLFAATSGNDALVEQLRVDIDLILTTSGVIIAALVSTVGLLWRALRSNQQEFIETLKQFVKEEKE